MAPFWFKTGTAGCFIGDSAAASSGHAITSASQSEMNVATLIIRSFPLEKTVLGIMEVRAQISLILAGTVL